MAPGNGIIGDDPVPARWWKIRFFKAFGEVRTQELIALPEMQAVAKAIVIRELGRRKIEAVRKG